MYFNLTKFTGSVAVMLFFALPLAAQVPVKTVTGNADTTVLEQLKEDVARAHKRSCLRLCSWASS